jgi:hypothetical protein
MTLLIFDSSLVEIYILLLTNLLFIYICDEAC